jgi:hypothetical protein
VEVLASVSAMPADGGTIHRILSYQRQSCVLCLHTVAPQP